MELQFFQERSGIQLLLEPMNEKKKSCCGSRFAAITRMLQDRNIFGRNLSLGAERFRMISTVSNVVFTTVIESRQLIQFVIKLSV
jgi:hypothetical protein